MRAMRTGAFWIVALGAVSTAACFSSSPTPVAPDDSGLGTSSGGMDAAASSSSGGDAATGGSSSGASSSSGGTDAATGAAEGGLVELTDIALPGPPAGPGALATDTVSGTVYVAVQLPYNDAGQNVGAVVVIDAATGTITTTIDVVGYVVSAIAVDSTSHLVYVSGFNGSATFMGEAVTVIDGTTNTIAGQIYPVPVQFEQYLAVDTSTHRVFGYDGGAGLAIMDGTARTVITSLNLAGYGPSVQSGGLAVDRAAHTVWALGPSATGGSLLSVIDGMANTSKTSAPYTGAPKYLLDDSTSTGDVFVVTQAPQTFVLDGPVSFAVPAKYTVDVVAPTACGTSNRAWAHDAAGKTYLLYFSSTGALVSVLPTVWSMSTFAACSGYASGYEIVMVEQTIGGTPMLLAALKRVKAC